MKLAVGGDHRGFDAVHRIGEHLSSRGHEVRIAGPCTRESCDYTDAAWAVGSAVAGGEAQMGILVCGTGIGTCIAANKIPGVRAALVHDEITAQMSRSHNDANVVCLSADLLGMRLIEKIIEICLSTPFSGGRHAKRLRKIAEIEQGRDPMTIVINGAGESAPRP